MTEDVKKVAQNNSVLMLKVSDTISRYSAKVYIFKREFKF